MKKVLHVGHMKHYHCLLPILLVLLLPYFAAAQERRDTTVVTPPTKDAPTPASQASTVGGTVYELEVAGVYIPFSVQQVDGELAVNAFGKSVQVRKPVSEQQFAAKVAALLVDSVQAALNRNRLQRKLSPIQDIQVDSLYRAVVRSLKALYLKQQAFGADPKVSFEVKTLQAALDSVDAEVNGVTYRIPIKHRPRVFMKPSAYMKYIIEENIRKYTFLVNDLNKIIDKNKIDTTEKAKIDSNTIKNQIDLFKKRIDSLNIIDHELKEKYIQSSKAINPTKDSVNNKNYFELKNKILPEITKKRYNVATYIGEYGAQKIYLLTQLNALRAKTNIDIVSKKKDQLNNKLKYYIGMYEKKIWEKDSMEIDNNIIYEIKSDYQNIAAFIKKLNINSTHYSFETKADSLFVQAMEIQLLSFRMILYEQSVWNIELHGCIPETQYSKAINLSFSSFKPIGLEAKPNKWEDRKLTNLKNNDFDDKDIEVLFLELFQIPNLPFQSVVDDDIFTGDNISADTAITVRSRATANLYNIRLFSDFVGFNENSPNGLIQIDANARFHLYSPNARAWLLSYIEPHIILSKIENKNRFLPLSRNAPDSTITPHANVLDLWQYASARAGAMVNIFRGDTRNARISFQVNTGFHFHMTPTRDSLPVLNAVPRESLVYSLAGELALYLRVINFKNFGFELQARAISFNPLTRDIRASYGPRYLESNRETYVTKTNFFDKLIWSPEFTVYYYAPNKPQSGAYMRARLFASNESSFAQIQIGYSISLNQALNLGKAKSAN